MFDGLLKNIDARQAPYYLYHFGRKTDLTPFNIDVWICAQCFKMVPAIGLQAECKPTNWKRLELDNGAGCLLVCSDCKRQYK